MAPESETELQTTKRKVAEHYLIDANSAVVDDEESATGIRYKLVETGESFDYQVSQGSAAATMLAIFGAKTLATNETSQVRNNPKGAGDAAEQMAAVKDRFALLDSGQWIDRTREGGGFAKIDKDALAAAIVTAVEAKGGTIDLVKVREKLEDDRAYLTKARKVPEVQQAYNELVGGAAVTTDDLVSALA